MLQVMRSIGQVRQRMPQPILDDFQDLAKLLVEPAPIAGGVERRTIELARRD